MARVRPIVVLALLAALVIGCDTPGASGRTFGAILPVAEPGARAEVTVIDGVGDVSGIAPLDRLPDGLVLEGPVLIGIAPDDPATLVVAWIGGVCDERTTIELTRDGVDRSSVRVATEHGFGGCPAVGITRAVAIRMNAPVDLATFNLVTGG